jgi:catechol 2,3-dioxygenase-like lactoylglutathione lyase family enzyme
MITSIHALIYSEDAAATRGFLRDVLGWPYVEDEPSEPGWLIFQTGPSELGVHPASWGSGETGHEGAVHHSISFMCDDIEATRAELAGKGATFAGEIVDRGFGLAVDLEVPGANSIMIYQPKHATAYDL